MREVQHPKDPPDDFPRPDTLADSAYVVVDVETSGFEPDEGAEVIEVAAVRFQAGKPIDQFASLVRPNRPIPPSASAVHFLTTKMVLGAPPAAAVMAALDDFVKTDEIVVAHNARFDRKFLPVLQPRTWCCSYRFARHLWSEAPEYKNQTLRYWLGLDASFLADVGAHRALGDCLVTGMLFQRELLAYQGLHPYASLRDVVEFVNAPLPVHKFMYGRKHYGKPMAEVPPEYLGWVLDDARKPDEQRFLRCDADTMAAVQRELHARPLAHARPALPLDALKEA